MTTTMHYTRTPTIPEIRQFLAGTTPVSFRPTNRPEAYAFMAQVLRDLRYRHRPRPEKGLIRAYLGKLTGYCPAQLTRLIGQWRQDARIQAVGYARNAFPRTYTLDDTELLARTDQAHETLSGPATRRILERAHTVFGDADYERLSGISVSHLYNLRGTDRYRETARVFTKTRPATVAIGQRKKPEPDGEPGYLRVDSVHQGDDPTLGKGLYHINLVDQVTQWELVVAVPRISERFLAPALELALGAFPFRIQGFHSDNGSEFINKVVAKLLRKLHIALTKNRPRRSTDNGLAETKNAAVIRKHVGYGHIPAVQAVCDQINAWYALHLNVYVNYHRPCAFATVAVDGRGKRHTTYPHEDYRTPYEKFRSLEDAEQYLRPGVSFADLDKIAYAHSDTEFAQLMQQAKDELFAQLKR